MPEETPVPNSTEPDITNVIESAMSRLAPRMPGHEAAPDPATERKNLGRRDYDLALARRLEQLQRAMGESPAAEPPATQAVSISPSAAPRTTQSATLLATALVSALVGAGAMWLAIGGQPASEPPPTQIVNAAPVPVAPPVAPQAPVAEAAAPAASELAPMVNRDEDQARELLEAWRQAWSSRDSDAYLSFYSPNFTPADGQKRAEWAAARRKNLDSRPLIKVEIRDINVERVDDQQLKLAFLQDYAAGSYRETAQPKILQLVRQEGKWLIAGEWQGTAPTVAPGK